jgi:DNA-binding Lrp family transcriptional regulator
MLASNEDVESVDVITGEWEFIVKIRARDQDDYWFKLQKVIKDVPIIKVNSMISIRQLKSEYTLVPESDITE